MTEEFLDEEQLDDDLDEEAYCPDCGALMDPDDTVCPQCGAEFGFYCPECDQEIPAEASICPYCGAELEEGFEDELEGEEEVESQAKPDVAVERATFCANCGEPIDEEDEECPSCGMDLCPDCGNPLDPDDDVCPHCGAEFAFSCPECGEDLPADADVCPHCGAEFEEDEEEDEEDD
jgi:predicted amidophosphoribosyltransferase